MENKYLNKTLRTILVKYEIYMHSEKYMHYLSLTKIENNCSKLCQSQINSS